MHWASSEKKYQPIFFTTSVFTAASSRRANRAGVLREVRPRQQEGNGTQPDLVVSAPHFNKKTLTLSERYESALHSQQEAKAAHHPFLTGTGPIPVNSYHQETPSRKSLGACSIVRSLPKCTPGRRTMDRKHTQEPWTVCSSGRLTAKSRRGIPTS